MFFPEIECKFKTKGDWNRENKTVVGNAICCRVQCKKKTS